MRTLLLTLFLIGPMMAAPPARAVEEPQWTLVHEDGPFQIRDYGPTVVAETQVAGERGAAINEGFRRLARYIFGGNEPRREIAMTAPVTQRGGGEQIAMTAPVAQAASGDGWVVAFSHAAGLGACGHAPPPRRQFHAPRTGAPAGAAWYWHFVDVVWLFLFVTVYWI